MAFCEKIVNVFATNVDFRDQLDLGSPKTGIEKSEACSLC